MKSKFFRLLKSHGYVILGLLLSTVGAAAQPVTNQYPWTASPTNGPLPLSVQFTAPATDRAGHTVTNWYWNFGDGSFSTDQNPGNTYLTAGTYFPSLAAIDDAGNTVVGYGPAIYIPTVVYTASPSNGVAPLTVQFTTANVDSGGEALGGWNWDFGDGNTASQQNPSHTYTDYGTFVPTLTATNSDGAMVYGIGPSVLSLALSIQNGGFETGDFTGWNVDDPSEGMFVDTGSVPGNSPHSGNYLAALGPSASRGFLSQNIATVPGQSYQISLWLNSPDGVAPNEFLAKWNGNTLFDQTNLPATGWTHLQFTARANSTVGLLELGYLDNASYLGLDDVNVVPISTSMLTLVRSGSNVILTWPTNNSVLTLQSTTNLMPPTSWITVSPAPVIINGQNIVTNSASGKQLFYKLSP